MCKTPGTEESQVLGGFPNRLAARLVAIDPPRSRSMGRLPAMMVAGSAIPTWGKIGLGPWHPFSGPHPPPPPNPGPWTAELSPAPRKATESSCWLPLRWVIVALLEVSARFRQPWAGLCTRAVPAPLEVVRGTSPFYLVLQEHRLRRCGRRTFSGTRTCACTAPAAPGSKPSGVRPRGAHSEGP